MPEQQFGQSSRTGGSRTRRVLRGGATSNAPRGDRDRSGLRFRWPVAFWAAALFGLLIGTLISLGLGWSSTRLPQLRVGGTALAASRVQVPAAADQVTLPAGSLIVAEGDSLIYGLASISEPSQPAFNGVNEPRVLTPFPDSLQQVVGAGVRVDNRGFPGDRAIDALTRWTDVPSGSLAVIMYGTNDADVRGRSAGTTPELYSTVLEALVRRRLHGGAEVILLLPPPVSSKAVQVRLDPYRAAALDVGRRTGVLVLDPQNAWKSDGAPLGYDGVHLTSKASFELAVYVAAHINVAS